MMNSPKSQVNSSRMEMIIRSLLIVLLCIGGTHLWAQGSLQFSQTQIVTDQELTVPAGKVWKVTSIYGEEKRFNLCLNIASAANHELERIRCGYTSETWKTLMVSYYTIASMVVNGKSIPCRINGLRNGSYDNFTGSNCDVQQTSRSADWSCANISSDPNIFPMWLGAGTTIKTGGPNTFLSVLEFNIIP